MMGLGGAIVAMDDATTRLVKELSDAKNWPARFKEQVDSHVDVTDRIRESGLKIEELERRAKEAMKRLGCVSPETRTVYHHMADMLITWQSFKDSLE
jgi:hypothetical protein